jgi:hypothetical protein
VGFGVGCRDAGARRDINVSQAAVTRWRGRWDPITAGVLARSAGQMKAATLTAGGRWRRDGDAAAVQLRVRLGSGRWGG